jgi:hypothetical protein
VFCLRRDYVIISVVDNQIVLVLVYCVPRHSIAGQSLDLLLSQHVSHQYRPQGEDCFGRK